MPEALMRKHRFTITEYYRLGEVGILSEDDRLELIEGEIIEMSPISSHHAAWVMFLGRVLHETVSSIAIVSVRHPVQFDDYTELLPDISLLHRRDDFYRHAHPKPDDVLLVIEISDTTLRFDREIKLPLYAKAGITELWVVNLPEEQIEIYAQPADNTYQTSRVFKKGTEAQAHSFPNVRVEVSALFG